MSGARVRGIRRPVLLRRPGGQPVVIEVDLAAAPARRLFASDARSVARAEALVVERGAAWVESFLAEAS